MNDPNKEKAESLNSTDIELQESSASTITSEITTSQHACNDKCHHVPIPNDIRQPPPLTRKEAKALKRSQYDKIAEKFFTSYVLQNTQTGQIVEIRAASSLHACNIIGWRPRKVNLLSERKIDPPKT